MSGRILLNVGAVNHCLCVVYVYSWYKIKGARNWLSRKCLVHVAIVPGSVIVRYSIRLVTIVTQHHVVAHGKEGNWCVGFLFVFIGVRLSLILNMPWYSVINICKENNLTCYTSTLLIGTFIIQANVPLTLQYIYTRASQCVPQAITSPSKCIYTTLWYMYNTGILPHNPCCT